MQSYVLLSTCMEFIISSDQHPWAKLKHVRVKLKRVFDVEEEKCTYYSCIWNEQKTIKTFIWKEIHNGNFSWKLCSGHEHSKFHWIFKQQTRSRSNISLDPPHHCLQRLPCIKQAINRSLILSTIQLPALKCQRHQSSPTFPVRASKFSDTFYFPAQNRRSSPDKNGGIDLGPSELELRTTDPILRLCRQISKTESSEGDR